MSELTPAQVEEWREQSVVPYAEMSQRYNALCDALLAAWDALHASQVETNRERRHKTLADARATRAEAERDEWIEDSGQQAKIVGRLGAEVDHERARATRAEEALRECKAALVAVKGDRPSVHTDRCWGLMNDAIYSAARVLGEVSPSWVEER